MSKFKVAIECDDIIEADNTDDAYVKFWENQMEEHKNLTEYIDAKTIIKEVCPHCEIELEDKMIDVDGTNLEEHKICPDCGYGTPALH